MNKVSGTFKKGTIQAVVFNADGTVKCNLGTVAYYHKNPLLRFIGSAIVKLLANRRLRELSSRTIS